jgi:GTPase
MRWANPALIIKIAMEKKTPIIALFGRTNVGKSTLFNCLTESKKALVAPIEGTTRDANQAEMNWRNAEFNLVDTGGIINLRNLKAKKNEEDPQDFIDQEVQKQARKMLERAALVLFLVDTRAGLLPQDKELAAYLKKNILDSEKIILVANKADSPRLREKIADFYRLSLGEPQAVSASTGAGTGDLLDLIVKKLKKYKNLKIPALDQNLNNKIMRVCILGKPNVGKSSLFNKILGENRVIVSPIPHTTREPQDTLINYKGQAIKLIDTAGMSRSLLRGQKEKERSLEKMGIDKSLQTLERSDMAIFMTDINTSLTHQDSKIIEEVIGRKKSLLILANKWDRVPEKDTKKYTQYIHSHLPFITWAPIQFISALTGEKVGKVLDVVLEVHKKRNIEISQEQLDEFVLTIIKHHKPTKSKGFKRPYIHKLMQTQTDPPKFELSLGSKDNLSESYVRFIENQLRKKFEIIGTPLSIYISKGRKEHIREQSVDKNENGDES